MAAACAAAAKVPRPTGYVGDYANLLDDSSRQALEADLQAFEQTTTHELAVVTLPSLNGDSIEGVAVELFKEWGIGKKGQDNGVLVLIASNDRQMRIEVGYGLEGRLPDGLAGQIVREQFTPFFKDGKYRDGILAGVRAIEAVIKEEQLPATPAHAKPRSNFFKDILPDAFVAAVVLLAAAPFTAIALILILLIFAGAPEAPWSILGLLIPGLVLDALFTRRMRRGFWRHMSGGSGYGGFGGGGGGGGFGGFGGGSSGGGGASGRW